MRRRRVEVLTRGLRQTARLLGITPPHLTDIEKGRRNPSEALLGRIATIYEIDEAELRAGWGRAEGIVHEVATQDSVTATKVPEFLRSARRLTRPQWDKLIEQARRMAGGKSGG
jgi:transcriptional regulator with XRE-family HTH domain